jgi:cardiolipin synthase
MLLTLPNLLTISRIAVVPVLVALLFFHGPWASWTALAVFLAASVTDWADGYLARRRRAVTPLGRFLDPIADKFLVAAVLVMLVASDRVTGLPVAAVLLILCRELLVSGLREYLAELRVGMPVSGLAKWKTATQMVALCLLIVGEAGPAALHLRLAGEAALWVALVLTLVTGWDYMKRGLEHMTAQPER